MNRLVAFILSALITLTLVLSASAVDLSEMTFEELVALRDQLNLAIWNSKEWQEVTVPQGIWKVGEDIPSGKWTVKALPDKTTYIQVGELDSSGQKINIMKRWVDVIIASETREETAPAEYTIDVKDGDYIYINPWNGPAVFTPYSGKPDLGFK